MATKPSAYLAAATINATVVNAGPTLLSAWFIRNLAAANRFVKLYDKATAPDPTTDVPAAIFGLPTSGFSDECVPEGIFFKNGLSFVMVTGAVNTDKTVCAANDVILNLFWQAAS